MYLHKIAQEILASFSDNTCSTEIFMTAAFKEEHELVGKFLGITFSDKLEDFMRLAMLS